MRRQAVAGALAAGLATLAFVVPRTGGRTGSSPVPPMASGPTADDAAWAGLGPDTRCASALTLVTQSDPWPTICRWRDPSDVLEGQSFPPPRGDAPYDDPHIEIYVDRAQSRDDLAHAIAHELGHMRHTREPTFVPAWLAARGLPPDTPASVWTEDYAEVFAALFAPPSDRWRAPTPRPSADALAELERRFFS